MRIYFIIKNEAAHFLKRMIHGVLLVFLPTAFLVCCGVCLVNMHASVPQKRRSQYESPILKYQGQFTHHSQQA